MARQIWRINKFHGGLSEGDKIGKEGAFLSGEVLDYRTNPDRLTLNSLITQETMAAGATMAALPKWIVPTGGIGTSNPTVDIYLYNAGGFLFRRPQGGTTWANRASLASSVGQGLAYFSVDDSLYLTGLATLARYGPLGWASTPSIIPLTGTGVASLQQDNDYHPIKEFLNFLCVGNGRFVATWDGTTFDPDRVDTYRGWRVRALEVFEDYLAIGCWKGTTISDSDKGMIFYWDGTASTWNFFTEVEAGGVNALLKHEGQLFVWAGPEAELYSVQYPGGGLNKVKKVPNIEVGGVAEVRPGAIDVWRGIPYFGFPGAGTATTALRGVYGYGAKNINFPKTLNLDFRLSTGSVGSPSMAIGAVKAIGPTRMFVGWERASTYGIDSVSVGTPFSRGTYESLIFDNSEPYRRKFAQMVKVTCLPLTTGQVIEIQYRADRASAYTSIGTLSFATDGAIVQKTFELNPLPFRFYELQLRLIFTATATAPEVTSVVTVFEPEESLK